MQERQGGLLSSADGSVSPEEIINSSLASYPLRMAEVDQEPGAGRARRSSSVTLPLQTTIDDHDLQNDLDGQDDVHVNGNEISSLLDPSSDSHMNEMNGGVGLRVGEPGDESKLLRRRRRKKEDSVLLVVDTESSLTKVESENDRNHRVAFSNPLVTQSARALDVAEESCGSLLLPVSAETSTGDQAANRLTRVDSDAGYRQDFFTAGTSTEAQLSESSLKLVNGDRERRKRLKIDLDEMGLEESEGSSDGGYLLQGEGEGERSPSSDGLTPRAADNSSEDDEGLGLGGALERQDSTESIVSNNSFSGGSSCDLWARRPLMSVLRNTLISGQDSGSRGGAGGEDGICPQDPLAGQKFDKPKLGVKNVLSLMYELGKNVCRLREDLFVVTFAPPQNGPSDDAVNEDDQKPSKRLRSSDNSQPTAQASVRFGKFKGKIGSMLRRCSTNSPKEVLSDRCLSMLRDIRPDTSDPDKPFVSPFVDSRHTFLEMCQLRHYQFDSLRRAKHSSMLLLYHLHHAFADHLRPHCTVCKLSIREVRWHCDQCDNHVDLCQPCVTGGIKHVHPLTPIRVTFS